MKSLFYNYLVLFGFLPLLGIESAYAGNVPMKRTNTWFGPSVIDCCKCISLCTSGEGSGSNVAQTFITSESTNFLPVKAWVMKNLYSSLNDCKNTDAESTDDTLMLTTLERRRLEDILVNIRLNRETLGPDYKHKIAELRNMLEVSSGDAVVQPK